MSTVLNSDSTFEVPQSRLGHCAIHPNRARRPHFVSRVRCYSARRSSPHHVRINPRQEHDVVGQNTSRYQPPRHCEDDCAYPIPPLPGRTIRSMSRFQAVLSRLLDTIIEACSEKICSSIAQRKFQALYPRLVIRSNVRPDWEDGERAISKAIVRQTTLFSSVAILTLLAHRRLAMY